LRNAGWLSDAAIELVNGSGITAISEREVVEVPNDLGILIVEGYAVPSTDKRSLFIEIDGHLHAATWGAPRGDVAMLHGGAAALNSGFSAMVPNWMLDPSVHRMRVAEVSEDNSTVWRGEKQVSFRIVR